jgi:hypothetical protein
MEGCEWNVDGWYDIEGCEWNTDKWYRIEAIGLPSFYLYCLTVGRTTQI